MGRQEKLLAKLLNERSTITWFELTSLLRSLGYQQLEGSGSRVKFDNGNPFAMINLHRPHPNNEIKTYAKRQVIEKLKAGGFIL